MLEFIADICRSGLNGEERKSPLDHRTFKLKAYHICC